MFAKNNFLETNWFDAEIEHTAPLSENWELCSTELIHFLGGGG